ncbi:MAG: AGE family epimerase/isomerase [Alphaproteobacteria bacterium]
MSIDLPAIQSWLFDEALPLWAGAGIDRERGGFVEQLSLSGRPAPGPMRRLRVQARQMYVYCHAMELGWAGPAREAVRQGCAFMTGRYWHPDGGWIFSVGPGGEPVDETRETYEQAFALYALAWVHRATGERDALRWIERTVDFLDRRLADPDGGGFHEALPDKLPRRQNPHMHMLEAMLALYTATGEDRYMARARALVELFRRRFLDSTTGTLGEFFDARWRPAAGVDGQRVEPGHHYEWVWLLAWYGRLSGEDVSNEAVQLYRFAEKHGTDPDDGLAYDGVLRDGTVHDDNKRLWVQTEALKAQIARWELAGDTLARDRAERLLASLFERYLSAGPGCWQDHLRRDGTGFARYAPASSFYHVFLALSEVMRVFGEPAQVC